MYSVYVLYSPLHQKIYIGITTNLSDRFLSHNQYATKGFTKKYRPWVIVIVERFENKFLALKRERVLKNGQGRLWIKTYLSELGLISA